MIEPPAEDLHVHLTVDDARTAQLAGCKFARTLAGADSRGYALALAEQEHLIARAIVDAGYSAEQARFAAGPTCTGAGNALLEHTAAEIGIDLAPLRTRYGIAQHGVSDPLLAGEPQEPGVLEDPQRAASQF